MAQNIHQQCGIGARRHMAARRQLAAKLLDEMTKTHVEGGSCSEDGVWRRLGRHQRVELNMAAYRRLSPARVSMALSGR
jgi:hypothetical protein